MAWLRWRNWSYNILDYWQQLRYTGVHGCKQNEAGSAWASLPTIANQWAYARADKQKFGSEA
jgi:hypothetical protein